MQKRLPNTAALLKRVARLLPVLQKINSQITPINLLRYRSLALLMLLQQFEQAEVDEQMVTVAKSAIENNVRCHHDNSQGVFVNALSV